MKRIYLDNNATTYLDPRLHDRFVNSLHVYGNPSSVHGAGRDAKQELIKARDVLATILDVRPQEIIFTASATEALNLVLRGFFGFQPTGHLITSKAEHAAVYHTVEQLQAQGLNVTYLDVGPLGCPTLEQVRANIRPDTRLIALMAANNETGVLTDIDAIADLAGYHNIAFVVDGVALFGKQQFQLHPKVSAISFSAHKFHGPKGVGIAVVRKGLKLQSYLTGGHQERGLRAGTENLPAIVVAAEAMRLAHTELAATIYHVRQLRDSFEAGLKKIVPAVQSNGQGSRVANTSNICFPNIDGEALLMYLDLHGVEASLGSACSSGAIEPSRVLLNMGLTREQALSSLRFSFGRFNTQEEVEICLQVLKGYFKN